MKEHQKCSPARLGTGDLGQIDGRCAPLRGLRQQISHSDQVERGRGHLGPELVAFDPAVAQLASTGDRFQPAEDLLNPLADALTDEIAELGRGVAIDATASLRGDVLGHVAGSP
jgi:hypothetical protein